MTHVSKWVFARRVNANTVNNKAMEAIKKNTITTADKLEIGDRFYFANDKNKVVWQKVDHEIKVTHFQTYKHWCLLASAQDNPKLCDTAKKTYVKPMRKETKVIFLRRVEG